MANPTIISAGFQKHVRLRAPYRGNTLVEQAARIMGSSSRLRGLEFVSENAGVDVTLSPGDYICVGRILDPGEPTREAGIIVKVEANVTIDVSGFTDPFIYGFVDSLYEDVSSPIQFLVTEAAPPPSTQYAPIIFKTGGNWFSNPAIGNDALSASSILASGTATKPAGINSTVNVVHNLGLGSYKVLLQAINLSDPVYTVDGLTTPTEVGELWTLNHLANDFDVTSDSESACDFVWAVIS